MTAPAQVLNLGLQRSVIVEAITLRLEQGCNSSSKSPTYDSYSKGKHPNNKAVNK